MKGLQHTDRLAAYTFNYPSMGNVCVDANPARNGDIVATVPALAYVKPYFLSHFQQGFRTYVCSSTFKVFDEGGKPYIGLLIQDSVCGERAGYRTEGDHYLPVHTSVETGRYASTEWVGKIAYLITLGDNWGITDDGAALGAIAVGTFKDRWQFRPNAIGWGARFVQVSLNPSLRTMNSPVTITASGSGDGSCCFGACTIEAYPEVTNAHGLFVEVDVNAFATNPLYEISLIQLNYTGATETVIIDGSPVVQPKTELVSTGSGHFRIPFDAVGLAQTVTMRVFSTKIDGSGCSCGDGQCCSVFELEVDVTANTGIVCTPATAPTPTTNDWRLFDLYTDPLIATGDRAMGITLGGNATVFGTPIALSNTTGLQAAIETALGVAGFSYNTVSVTFSLAPANAGKSLLEIIVTNVNLGAVLDSLQVSIDNAATTDVVFAIV